MKTIFFSISIFFTLFISAQDSTKVDTVKNFTLNTDFSISTRNVWRGASYGNAPSIQGNLTLVNKYFEIGTCGTTPINGQMFGFGMWLEKYVTFKHKNFSLTFDDYFFFFPQDSLNNYFEYQQNTTNHLIEARLKYTYKKFSCITGYTIYSNILNKTKGLYIESEYNIKENISIIVSYLTDASWLNFYDKGGITCIGFIGKRNIQVVNFNIPIKAQFLINPNYKNVSNYTNLGKNPVYFIISAVF